MNRLGERKEAAGRDVIRTAKAERIRLTLLVPNLCSMTRLLEKAIAQLKTLPEKEQDALAQTLLHEMMWESYAPSTGSTKLSNLAAEALEEYRSGNAQSRMA